MSFSRKIAVLLTLLSLAACAAPMQAPHSDSVPTFPRPRPRVSVPSSLSDPGQALKSALDLYKSGNSDGALLVARMLQEQYPGTPWYKRSLFLAEQAFIQADRPSEADAAMMRVKAEYPELADYAVYLLADYHFSKARYTEAAALYQDVTVMYPKSSLAVRAAYRGGLALLQAWAYAPASEVFDQFLRDNPRSELCPDVGLGLARALTAEADTAAAVRAYQDVFVRYPGTPADQDIARELAVLKGGGVEVPELTPDALAERGRNLFRANQFDKAVEAFTQLLGAAPDYQNRAEILLRRGIAQFNLGRRTDSAATLERMVQEHPRDQRVPEALYWLGKSYSKLGDREKGVKTFQKILISYFESEWADDALFLTGNIYREANDLKKALTFYNRLAAEYPESKFADSAIWWKAWSQYGSGEYRKAEQTLRDLITRYPRSFLVNQALYWQGRTAEKAGNVSRAAAYYARVLKRAPFTYYGYRAADRLTGIEVPDALEKADPDPETRPACEGGPCPDDPLAAFDSDDGPPVWTDEALKILSQDPSFRKSLELLYLNMKKEAAAELSAIQDRAPRKRGALLGLSKTFFELGDYYRSLILVLRNYERYLEGRARETPEDFWLLAYPQGYWDSILSYSRKYGQDPYFVAAIIREESQFHTEALSPAGARGVMQVMPSTGQWVAQNIRLRSFDADKLYDSDTAINIGTWYISRLMKQFRGEPLFVAAAYNAGPDAVLGWLGKNGRGAERDEFVESIPFSETRGYVKKVLRNYSEYKRIYGKTAQDIPRLPAGEIKAIGSLEQGRDTKRP